MDNFPGTFAFVQIHGGDAYTTPWGNARMTFYATTGYPTVWFDGVIMRSGSYDNVAADYARYLADYNTRMAVATDVTIQLGAAQVSGSTYDVTATVGIEAGGVAKQMRIYIVQVLDHWPPIPQPKPQYSRNGFKQDAATQDVNLSPGGSQVITRQFTFDADSWSHQSDIRIIAWAQKISGGKDVFQAAILPLPHPLGDLDGNYAVNLDDVDDFVLALVDPAGYQTLHPTLDPVALGDTNGDDALNGLDIQLFIPLVGVDMEAPTPNPMTFAVIPAPTSTTTIAMTATTATDAGSPPVSYFFEFVSGGSGGEDSPWQSSTDYTDAGLAANTGYTYRVKARDSATVPNETGFSADASVMTYIETPTGVSFGTTTVDSIELNATGMLTNLTLGLSGIYFDSTTSGGNGGINEWVQTTTDTATLLTPDTDYTFRVNARNQDAVATVYSGTASKRTLAAVPAAPTLSDPTIDSMDLDVNANGNPASTVFAIQCTATDPADTSWNGQYVDAAGNPSVTETWQTDGAWAVITVHGLTSGTIYTFAVKARNGDLVETALGPEASMATP